MKVPDDSAEVTMIRLEGPCGMGLLSSGNAISNSAQGCKSQLAESSVN